MASYASVAKVNHNKLMDLIVDLNVFMDPREAFNRSYIDQRARELAQKFESIVGRGKLASLTYANRGNWVAEFTNADDAEKINNSAFTISGCQRDINTKKRTDYGFLITIKCDPLIEDEQIEQQLTPFVEEIYSKRHTTYSFDPNLRDGRRLFRVKLGVKLEQVPHHIEIEGVRIALHYAGKSFFCKTCGNTHQPQLRCPSPPQQTEIQKKQTVAEINTTASQAKEPTCQPTQIPKTKTSANTETIKKTQENEIQLIRDAVEEAKKKEDVKGMYVDFQDQSYTELEIYSRKLHDIMNKMQRDKEVEDCERRMKLRNETNESEEMITEPWKKIEKITKRNAPPQTPQKTDLKKKLQNQKALNQSIG